ncbi:flagellar protein export ATPase FliI [Sulfitobacter sp. S0837]|uniref:FliI/YscN family ATPase n=1 Tax=Sulfitobacter maritimus TaxID=2741719 RepID=UPI001583E9A0|nr:FliI/YscN family ATPase [Sulfitobacter maritimus]NUH64980.1 flagellar protein export ATPase FliI [Sulfitobacter maritimus]
MQTLFSELTSFAREAGEAEITGEVRAITGITLTAVGLERVLGIGERCIVHGSDGPVHAEVVGIGTQGTELLPFGSWRGVAAGDRVEVAIGRDVIRPDESWKGRVISASAAPLDGKGHLAEGTQPRPLRASPPGAFDRKRIGPKLATHVRALDVFTPLCQGQRLGIFAGSGVGKSTLMAMLARYTECDVVVMALVGERGREVQDFIASDLGPEGMEKAVLVVATGDEPPLTRRQAAWTAMAVAEHFRDQGQHVLLLMDSVTRFAMAQREIGLASREPPTAKGYPPTVFSELPQMLERAGPGPVGKGDITAIFTVLVDGDDMNDPIADAVRGITDGHIVLDRRIAEKGRYPAIDLLASVSRTLPDCHSDVEYTLLTAAHKALAAHADMEELIRIGAYRSGSNPELDRAIAFAGPCETFLGQRKSDHTPPATAFAEIAGMLDRAGISPG